MLALQMLNQCHALIYLPVAVLSAMAAIALAVGLLSGWRMRERALRAAPPSVRPQFRPVLVHDRSRQSLIRSRTTGLSRAARPKIRLVYNGG